MNRTEDIASVPRKVMLDALAERNPLTRQAALSAAARLLDTPEVEALPGPEQDELHELYRKLAHTLMGLA